MTIKGWFLDKNFTQNERYIINLAMNGDELETLRETEKAVQSRQRFRNTDIQVPEVLHLKRWRSRRADG